MRISDIPGLLKGTWNEWNTDRAPRLGAALAFYTVLSLSPLLLITIAIAGAVFGQEAAQGEVLAQARSLIGQQGAEAIQTMIQNADRPAAGIIATILSIITLLFGASGVFGELQGAMNTIWGVEPKPDRGIKGVIMGRLFSFGLVLAVGFLLLVSLILSSVLSVMTGRLSGALPGYDIIWQMLEFIISFLVITLVFAALYKFIPDVEISWRDVWIGALVTSILFSIGRFALGLYLGNSSTTSVYGAAGSLVVILLWVYYSAQILFFGAEFTQVYANRFGSKIEPSEHAVAVGKWNPGEAARQAAGAERGATQPGQAAPQGAQPAGVEPAKPAPLGLLVPFSFAVGLFLGVYRRIKG